MSIKNVVFMMIKPDAVNRGRKIVRDMLADIESRGWKIIDQEEREVDARLASRFYQEHSDKPFFNDLIEYITSGKVIALAVHVPSVEEARAGVGATDPKEAEIGTIRNKYGLSKNHNSIHCSDSVASAEYELGLFFKIHDNVHVFSRPIENSDKFEFLAKTNHSPMFFAAGTKEEFKYATEALITKMLFRSIRIDPPS